MSSTRQLISRETLYRIIDIWAAEYHQALGNCAAYGSKHFGFYQDARKILRQVRAAEIEGTIFDYIVEVLRDASKRGYDDELHYPGLKKGYLAWARGEQPAPAWNPAGGLPPLPEIPPIRSSKEVSKQSAAVDLLEKALEELEESKREVEEDEDEDKEDENEEQRPADKGKGKAKEVPRERTKEPTAKAGPSTSGRGRGGRHLKKSSAIVNFDDDADADADGVRDIHDPPCTRCKKLGIACEMKVERKGTRVPACLPCNRAKCACSLPAKLKAAGKAKDVRQATMVTEPAAEDEPTPEQAKRRRRPAPKVVEAGVAGEFSSKWKLPFVIHSVTDPC